MTLQSRLKALGTTQREVAALTGLTTSTMTRYATGKLPTPLWLWRLLDAWEQCPAALADARGGLGWDCAVDGTDRSAARVVGWEWRTDGKSTEPVTRVYGPSGPVMWSNGPVALVGNGHVPGITAEDVRRGADRIACGTDDGS